VDLSIDCGSPEHKLYDKYSLFFIGVYPIGVPVMYFLLLRMMRQYLDPGQAVLEFDHGAKEGLQRAIEARKKLEAEHEDIGSLTFLYSSYEPKYYWFEVIETLRKLVLTGGLIFLGTGTRHQIGMR
jgi:hypothetical protein